MDEKIRKIKGSVDKKFDSLIKMDKKNDRSVSRAKKVLKKEKHDRTGR